MERRLVAILCADVVGYSRLMEADEEATIRALSAFRQVVDELVANHHGRVFGSAGDSVIAEFASAVEAVRRVAEIERHQETQGADLSEDRRMRLRIGINLGDIVVEDGNLLGGGVNVAARLEGLAEPGGIRISGKVYEEVRNKLSIAFEDLGEQEVKNIPESVRVYYWTDAAIDPMPGTEVAEGALPLPNKPSIAVLPFTNMSGDPEQEYFSDGIAEDIITALSAWRSFPVIARSSTFAYKEKSPDIRQVALALGARYVLEGCVRKIGNRVRITAQLIDAESGHHVWGERYDRDLDDIFALQDEITQRIAATAEPELEKAELKRTVTKKPSNLDAWDYYRRGMALLNEFSKEGNEQARELLRSAIELDPSYGQAHVGLAESYHRDIDLEFTESRQRSVAQCLEAARRAVKLDDTDSMAHWILGLAFQWSGQYEIAVAQEQRAVELNPSNAQAYVSLGTALAFAGQPERGIPNIEKALQLNPQDPRSYLLTTILARTHLHAGNYEETAAFARKAIARKSDHPLAHVFLAASLGHLGDEEKAREALEACERVKPGYVAEWVRAQSAHGDVDGNRQVLDGLRKAGLPE